MATTRLVLLGWIALLLSLSACQNRQFPTVTLYESPASFVRLEADPTVEKGAGHSHPVSSGVRSSRPARLFSFGLLDGLPVRLRRPYV
ncbi:MAG: hypothetical protein E8D43_01465 [Nitrospira sp.]|nr:MAG: hypothetical protein E8D43_01465 [Nitrospira sp.]